MTQPEGLKAIRTYPQPDSPKLGSSPRNRALAVFKYLLNLEPEQAKDHPFFECIMNAFVNHGLAVAVEVAPAQFHKSEMRESLIPELAPGEIPLAFRKPTPTSPGLTFP